MRIWIMVKSAAVVMAGVLMIVGSAAADPFMSTESGWQVATEVDADGDGITAYAITSKGFSTWGPITSNALVELAPTGGFCDDDSNVIESTNTHGSYVIRTQKSDLFYGRVTSGTSCSDLTTSTFTYTANWEITGGTGRFEGATGSFTSTGTGIVLAVEQFPVFRMTHAALSGSSEGEIVLAK